MTELRARPLGTAQLTVEGQGGDRGAGDTVTFPQLSKASGGEVVLPPPAPRLLITPPRLQRLQEIRWCPTMHFFFF